MRKISLRVLTKIGFVISGMILLGIGLFVGTNVWEHYRRNPEAYCKTFNQEKQRLTTISGTKYHSDLFDLSVDNPNELTRSYEVLTNIAPKDTLPYAETLRNEYRKGDTSGFRFSSLIGSEVKIRNWNAKNCTGG